MYAFSDLQREVSDKIAWLMANNGKDLHPDWITQAVMADHAELQGVDADFYTCCARPTIRKEVREQINELEPKEPPGGTNTQLVLEGFEHLQKFYVVKRDGTQVGVRIENLTDDEIEAKINEYASMGRSLLDHSDELQRYLELRRSSRMASA